VRSNDKSLIQDTNEFLMRAFHLIRLFWKTYQIWRELSILCSASA